MIDKSKLRVIAFDADDTLWVNEPNFQNSEKQFCELMEDFLPAHSVSRELLKVEIQNLPDYGYGVKSFVLSMIESAIEISNGAVGLEVISKIMGIGKELLHAPNPVIEGVEKVLQTLHNQYKLIVVTKGDLLDQERKLEKSGLGKYFHHTEILSEKKPRDYAKLFERLDIQASQILMIGNSLKSDVIPVLDFGGYGIHIPYHTTWEYEKIDVKIDNPKFLQLSSVKELTSLLL